MERYKYDAYGKRTIYDPAGAVVRTASSYGFPVCFTGRYEDTETGLLYFRARYYSTSQGRFVGRDPLGYVDGMGLYAVYFIPGTIDPFGEESSVVPGTDVGVNWSYFKSVRPGQLGYTSWDKVKINCYCLICDPNGKEHKVSCFVNLAPKIFISDRKIFPQGYSRDTTYGHEQKHVRSVIKYAKSLIALVDLLPCQKLCDCEDSARIQEAFLRSHLHDYITLESAHSNDDSPGAEEAVAPNGPVLAPSP